MFSRNRALLSAWRPRRMVGVLLFLPFPAAGSALGQEAAAPSDTARQQQEEEAECEQGRIARVVVDNHSIFDMSDTTREARFDWAYRTANRLHVQTREAVVRRELLQEVGDCYDPELAEESARLIRRLGFIASADVRPFHLPDETVQLEVETRDEWSTRVSLRGGLSDGDLEFEGARLEELNLLGTGQTVDLFYYDDRYRTEYGARYATPQLARTRWNLGAQLLKNRAGTTVSHTLTHPFVGEVGRWAAEQIFRRRDRFFGLLFADSAAVLVPMRDQELELAVATRVGHGSSRTTLGAALTYHELTYPGGPDALLVEDEETPRGRPLEDEAMREVVAGKMGPLSSVRLGFLVGQRNIWWERRSGFDSMRGVHDIRLGVETQLGVARALTAVERDDDIFSTFRLYTGFAPGNGLVVSRLRLDARRNLDAPVGEAEWDDVLGEGELLGYLRPSPDGRQTFLLRIAGVGGWHTATPFQLTLGGDRALRGYSRNRFPGGRRVVVSLEDRVYFGWPFAEVLDLGGTVFLEAGRVWAGDVAFGRDSGWRYSAGIGLRGAFPTGSRHTYRIDLAVPVGSGGERDFQVIVSMREVLGVTAPFGDPQFLRSRLTRLGGGIFGFGS